MRRPPPLHPLRELRELRDIRDIRDIREKLQVLGEGLVVPGVDQGGEPLAGSGVGQAVDLLEQGGTLVRREFEIGQQAVVGVTARRHPVEET